MESEENSTLPLLIDVLTKGKPDEIVYSVYRKPTHTDRYLNAEPGCYLSQKQGIINTEQLDKQLHHLRMAGSKW